MSVTAIDRDELLERLLHHVKKAAANEAIDKVFLPLLEERDLEIARLHAGWGEAPVASSWLDCATAELAQLRYENQSLRYRLASQERTLVNRVTWWRAVNRDRRHWKNLAKIEKERHFNWEARWEEVRADRDFARIIANNLAHNYKETDEYGNGYRPVWLEVWEELDWSKQIPVTDA